MSRSKNVFVGFGFVLALIMGVLFISGCIEKQPIPVPTPTPTPVPTPQPPHIMPTPTPTPVSIVTPTPAPPTKSEKVIIYPDCNPTLKAYAWQADIEVEHVSKAGTLKEELKKAECSGIWILPTVDKGDFTDTLIFDLSEFVKSGGRVFFEITPSISKKGGRSSFKYPPINVGVFSDSFQNYFDIALIDEKVAVNVRYPMTPLWEGRVGIPLEENPFYGGYFLPKDERQWELQNVISESTDSSRAILAYRRFGKGEVLFLSASCRGSWSSSLCLPESIAHVAEYGEFAGKYVDEYNNKQAMLETLKWLLGKREYHE